MMILDTNVISALMRQSPEQPVVEWLNRQPRMSIWTTSVTIFEIRLGLHIMAPGKRRSLLLSSFEAALQAVGNRIASFDPAAAEQAAELAAMRRKKGRTGELRDTMIAGIVLANHATLATRNIAHFQDLSAQVVDPWVD